MKPTSIKIHIEKGKSGRWRWYAYDQRGIYVAGSSIRGFDSQEDAIDGSNLVVQGCPEVDWVDASGESLDVVRRRQAQMTDSQRMHLDTLSDHLQAATVLITELRNEEEEVKLKPSPPAT